MPAFPRVTQEFRVTANASVPEESKQRAEPRVRKTLPRAARLLRHADFERVYRQGQRQFSPLLTVFYLVRPEAAGELIGLRIGFTVSRALGGAVQRNRIKRRLREAIRLTKPSPGPQADVVINPKKVVLTADFDVLLNEIRKAFVVIERKLGDSEAGTPDSRRRKRDA